MGEARRRQNAIIHCPNCNHEFSAKIGATGDYPRGKISDDDEGGLNMAIGTGEGGTVKIDFGKQVKWIGLPREQAVAFAHKVIEHAMGMRCNVHVSPLEVEGETTATDTQ